MATPSPGKPITPAASRKPAMLPKARRARKPAPKPLLAPGSAKARAEMPAAPKATEARKPAEAPRVERTKLVRDSFTMPKADFEMIGALKQRALKQGQEIKKSELLRAGLHALAALGDGAFVTAVAGVPRLKTGRPHKKGRHGSA